MGRSAKRRRILASMLLGLALASCRDPARSGGAAAAAAVPEPSERLLETRRYRFGIDVRTPLVSGWSGQHEWSSRARRRFVWATDEEAVFALTVLRIEDKQALVVLRAAKEPQRIDVRLNGREVARLDAVVQFREYRFELPAEALRLGSNELSFRHSTIRESGNPRLDPRRFAAAYSEILLGPECLRLRPHGPPEPTHAGPEPDGTWTIAGPAALEWPLAAGPATPLRTALELVDESAPAEVTLSLRRGEESAELGSALLAPSWIGRTVTRTIDAAIPERSGPSRLRLLVRPRRCEALRATVRLRDLAFDAGEESLQSETEH